ncbi:MAG: 30S ribosomal protein S7 [candidate division WS6 bacterium OLB20]|uniref:Small ribosomal subunit protein uS7 n=1 Tax=candidate division WS6 bacterium OLB20 TaxID=1617426 RepID=A0A136LZF3_9BACT|nr:MAG: 30S ribosomal protein S7 [candidate division WS6 bacterium OLB20]
MRGKQAKKRELRPDAMYSSRLVTKLINYVMLDGKKVAAEKVVYGALDKLATVTKMKPLEALELAIGNVKPRIEVRSRRVGGANYQVPVPVAEERQLALALRWITKAVRDSRGGKPTADRLADELIAATKKEGTAYKKREDTVKMAEANKAFSHLSW